MRYLLRVNHTNEYADDHQFAVLDLGRDLARCVLKRRRQVQAMILTDSSLCEVAYFDYSADWYDSVDLDSLSERGWLSDEARYDFDAEGICVLADDADLGNESECTSHSRMVFRSFGVSWVSCAKHTSDEFSTEALSFEVFEEVVAQEPAAAVSSPPPLL